MPCRRPLHLAALAALIALPLGGCLPSDGPTQAKADLPPAPSDIQICFRDVAGLPDRDLSAADVEQLWKLDRYHAVLEQRCGLRFLAWYNDLRAGWR